MNKREQDSGAVDALKSIKEAEEEAKRIVREAREKVSPDLVQKAYTEAEAMKKNLVAEARKKAEIKRKAIVSKARKEAEKITKKAKEEEASLLRETEKNIPRAVDKVEAKIKEILARGAL